jgi:hypothetical protein
MLSQANHLVDRGTKMAWKNLDARREYNREYQRKWYRKNRELHLARVQRVIRRLRAETKKYLDECKRQPCTDCGLSYPPYVMDFDHVRGDKVANLSQLRNGRAKWEIILAEIAKCEIVCANCHRQRTHLRHTGGDAQSPEPFQFGPEWVCVLVPG